MQPGAMNPSELHVGSEVVGADGAFIGHLQDVHEHYVSAERPAKADVYIPFIEIQDVADGKVVVNVPARDIDLMGWSKIPVP